MSSRFDRRGVAALAFLVVVLAGSSTALTSGARAARAACGAPVVVKVVDTSAVKINRYFEMGMHFSPGKVSVQSGCKLTFEYDPSMPAAMLAMADPHTLTIASASQLPKTLDQVENCQAACGPALGHLKNPKDPEAAGSPANPIVSWVLHAGKPTTQMTIGGIGDSVAIVPTKAHRAITVTVTAASGTTLHFLCAVHPWMQGEIVVT
jgi:plastocyanin